MATNYLVCSVYDQGTETFVRPVFLRGRGEALRMFEDQVNRPEAENPMFNHPGDFQLFVLGTWDDESGRFVGKEIPEKIVDGSSVSRKDVK